MLHQRWWALKLLSSLGPSEQLMAKSEGGKPWYLYYFCQLAILLLCEAYENLHGRNILLFHVKKVLVTPSLLWSISLDLVLNFFVKIMQPSRQPCCLCFLVACFFVNFGFEANFVNRLSIAEWSWFCYCIFCKPFVSLPLLNLVEVLVIQICQ